MKTLLALGLTFTTLSSFAQDLRLEGPNLILEATSCVADLETSNQIAQAQQIKMGTHIPRLMGYGVGTLSENTPTISGLSQQLMMNQSIDLKFNPGEGARASLNQIIDNMEASEQKSQLERAEQNLGTIMDEEADAIDTLINLQYGGGNLETQSNPGDLNFLIYEQNNKNIAEMYYEAQQGLFRVVTSGEAVEQPIQRTSIMPANYSETAPRENIGNVNLTTYDVPSADLEIQIDMTDGYGNFKYMVIDSETGSLLERTADPFVVCNKIKDSRALNNPVAQASEVELEEESVPVIAGVEVEEGSTVDVQ